MIVIKAANYSITTIVLQKTLLIHSSLLYITVVTLSHKLIEIPEIWAADRTSSFCLA